MNGAGEGKKVPAMGREVGRQKKGAGAEESVHRVLWGRSNKNEKRGLPYQR